MKIKDRIMLGVITGVIASLPGKIINNIEYRKGLTEQTYQKAASSLFVKDNQLDTLPGKIIGAVANQVLTVTAGIGTTYLLSLTGRDHAVVKGIGIGMLYWMFLEGLPSNLGLTISHKKPMTPLLSILDHIVFGATCGFVASNLGDESLFPETNNQLSLQAANQTR